MASPGTQSEPLLRKADFAAYLESKARLIAPRDIEDLLAEAEVEAVRTRAAGLSRRMGQQMGLALEILADHASGECPQIPFYTISVLAEAVYYFLDPNDVIPDWIPDIGRLDDALVLELAYELGADGIHRYCAWKDIDASSILPPEDGSPAPSSMRANRPAAKSASKRAAPKRPSPAKAAAKKVAKPAVKKKVAKKKAGKKKAAKAVAKRQAGAKTLKSAKSAAKKSSRSKAKPARGKAKKARAKGRATRG